MKKLLLCLLVVFCLVGCTVEKSLVSATIINNTDKVQKVSVFSNSTGNLAYAFEIEPYKRQDFTLDSWFKVGLSTEKVFNESFVCNFTQNNTWVIENSPKTAYTVYNELPFDVTFQNFSIVDGVKSSPCYSVVVPRASSISTATINVYPEWLGSIWDLENRNISSIYDYNNKLLQSVIVDGVTYYYEIVVEGTNIYIRNR